MFTLIKDIALILNYALTWKIHASERAWGSYFIKFTYRFQRRCQKCEKLTTVRRTMYNAWTLRAFGSGTLKSNKKITSTPALQLLWNIVNIFIEVSVYNSKHIIHIHIFCTYPYWSVLLSSRLFPSCCDRIFSRRLGRQYKFGSLGQMSWSRRSIPLQIVVSLYHHTYRRNNFCS